MQYCEQYEHMSLTAFSKTKWQTELRFNFNLSKKATLSESTSKSEPGTFPFG